jgi:hypothetical protein
MNDQAPIEALVDLHATPVEAEAAGSRAGADPYGWTGSRPPGALDSQRRRAPLAVAAALHAATVRRVRLVEPGRDGTRVTRGLEVKALANNPYRADLEAMKPSKLARWFGFGSPVRGSSGARFGTVARALRTRAPRSEEEALALLEEVVMRGRTQ